MCCLFLIEQLLHRTYYYHSASCVVDVEGRLDIVDVVDVVVGLAIVAKLKISYAILLKLLLLLFFFDS